MFRMAALLFVLPILAFACMAFVEVRRHYH
jgi:hypothetical protein